MRGTGKRRRVRGIGLRCAAYALAFGVLAAVPPGVLEPHSLCILYHITGRRCPGCGMTRAFCCILHGELAQAWAWNPFCALLFPLCVFLAADEAVVLAARLWGKDRRRSAVERLFGLEPERARDDEKKPL